jgi:hypothetical protein
LMWLFQLFARAGISAVVAAATTVAIHLWGEPEASINRLYSDFFPAVIAILGVLVTAMAVFGGLLFLRRDTFTGPAFRQTIASFRWVTEYSTAMCVALIVGRNIRLTPAGWVLPAIFLAVFSFVYLLVLLTGLVRAVADALEG